MEKITRDMKIRKYLSKIFPKKDFDFFSEAWECRGDGLILVRWRVKKK